MEPVTRRSFLVLAAGGAIVIALPGCAPEVGLSATDQEALLRVARLLYPHDTLPDDVYQQVLRPLQRRAEEDPVLAAAIGSGVAELDRTGVGNWLTASRDDQIEALRDIEGGSFFETVQEEVRARLYDHPTVWELIGYEGSSVEYGGYIHRGFDDIDWLPEG